MNRLQRVSDLPCCICYEYWLPQLSPTQAHHCIHGRYGQKRAPDEMTIPLCEGHHTGLMDTSKLAIHKAKREWAAKYGPDTNWINWTDERLRQQDEATI